MIVALRALAWCLTAGLRVVLLLVALLSIVTLWALTWLLAQLACIPRASGQRDDSGGPSPHRRAGEKPDTKPSGTWWL